MPAECISAVRNTPTEPTPSTHTPPLLFEQEPSDSAELKNLQEYTQKALERLSGLLGEYTGQVLPVNIDRTKTKSGIDCL